MFVYLQGHKPGAEDNPMITAGAILDQPTILPPVKKDRLEDLQLWGALSAIAQAGIGRHPLSVRVGSDPPDRIITFETQEWGTELTILTAEDVRQNLGPIRQLGRRLQNELRSRVDHYGHLVGRIVSLTALPDRSLPKNPATLLDELLEVLREDKGFAGQGADLTAGPPKQLGLQGIYGDYGPFHILVNNNPGSTELIVSATSQVTIYQDEAIAALNRRIQVKDEPGNDIVVVTCGAPDEYGHTCPVDAMIFKLLWEARQAGVNVFPENPTNIKGFIVHLWGTLNFLVWGKEEMPWKLPEG